MNIIIPTLAIIGAATLMAVGAALASVAVENTRDWLATRKNACVEAGWKQRNHKLGIDAWAFEESPSTRDLLANFANDMNVECAREVWRKDREQEARKAAGVI